MIIRRKIYWHAAVIATASGSYDPGSPIGGQKAASSLQKDGDTTDSWLLSSAVDFIYGVKNCKKIPISLHIENDEVLDVDTNGNPYGMRADNPMVAPGDIRFILPPSVVSELMGDPVEIKTAADFSSLVKIPIRYRLFAVYKSGPNIACSDVSVPDSYFSSENIPGDVVPSNDGASRTQIIEAMGPVMDLDPQGGETGFYVKMKSHDPITRIGCCDILAGTTSSSSSLPGTGSCPTTAVSELISEASEYRMWMVRQNVDNKFNGNPGVAELAYADLSTAIDTGSGEITPSSILWNHAGFINFEDIHPSVFSSLANPIGYANESGKRQQFRIITPNMFDLGKNMPVYIQHIAWDNRGFLWALCSGGFKMLPSDAISDFTTTEGVYRILPGGWYFATSHIYTWGGGNQGSKTAASLIDGMVGKIKQAAAGYVENNSSSYTSFTLLLDEEGFIHKKVEAIDNTGTSMASWPDFNSAGVRFSEIDAGNGIVCAVSNTGELFAWNLVSALHPSFNSFEAAVVAANASTQTYLHCCAALTPSSGLIIASRSSGATVDSFPISDPSGIVAAVTAGMPTGGRITRVTAGRSFAAVLYIDSAGVGRVISSGTINAQSLSTVIGTTLTSPTDRDVVFIDAGFEFLAVCLKTAGSADAPLLRTYTAPAVSGFMIPDDLRIGIGLGIQADKVYCGYERMIAIDADGKINCIGSDDYAFTSKNTISTPDVMGRSISVDLHARESFNGNRKFAVMAAGMPSDQNNGSVSIFVKFLPDNSVPASTDATVDGEWQFLKKIYADDFTTLAGSMVNSEFGYSVCVAGNNDIIVGAPGVRKVCIIRKTGIPNTIDYVVHAIISSPSTLEPANRFGHAVKWLPTGSAYGMIAIGAPVIPPVPLSLGGAIVMSAYSDDGVVNARIASKRATDISNSFTNNADTSGNFISGQFGYAFDVCIPSVTVGDGVPAVGRYNLAVADGVYGFVLQWNCQVTTDSLMQLVGSLDVIQTTANDNTNFGYSVAYTSSTRSANDRKQQLAISQFGNETSPSTTASQGDIFILNPSIEASNGTMHFAIGVPGQILNGGAGNLGNFDTSSGLVFGTKIKAESGVMIIQGSIPTSSNPNAAPLRNHAYFVYKYDNEKSSNSEFSEWRLDRFFTDINSTTIFHPDCCVFFKRRIHGHELLVSFPTARANGTTVGHTTQGKILSIPDYGYPMGCGRRLKDITSEYASVSVKCAAVGRKHQTLVASDGLHYQLPRYVDAKLCTAAPITNDGAVLDDTLQIAVSKLDPIDSDIVLNGSIYHFGSMASFVISSSTVLPSYNTVTMPLYSSASKTVRVAEMHWRPFKVLDRPTQYEPLIFPGDATFKLVCDSDGNPVGPVEQGQSGAFCTPHLDGDGTADADIDNNVNARNVINTGQVYYLQGTESSAGIYKSSVVGSVINDIAINPAVNPSNPLDNNNANIEWVPLFSCSCLAQVYQAQYSSGTSNSEPFIKLNPIKWAYYGRYFNTAVPAGFPSFTKRYGLQIFPPTVYPRTLDNDPPVLITASILPADILPQSISQGRKVFWNVLSQKNASNVKGKLKLFYADLYASILQPSYANLLNRSEYTEQNWHRYLSHVTDTVQNVQALQRQSISGITNNPISYGRIYSPASAWPTIQFRPALYSNPPTSYLPLNTLWANPGNASSGVILTGVHIPTFVGDIYKQHVPRENGISMPAPAAIWRMTFQDFLGRGAGILLSKRGTRVNSNPIAWPVLRNQLSFNLDLGGYNYWKDTTAAETAPAERTEGFAPGWFDIELGITGDHECLVAGMSVFPTFASLSVPAYGVVSGRLSIVDANSNLSGINSQLGYLYTLRGVVSNNTRNPVDFDDGSFTVPPALHATGCGAVYIDTGTPDNDELLILSLGTFSCGSSGDTAGGASLIDGRQHLWMQKRKFNGAVFAASSLIEDVATTLPNPTAAKIQNTGVPLDPKQCAFWRYGNNSKFVHGSNTLIKSLQPHTSINVWNVIDDNNDPVAIIAIGGRVLAMRATPEGADALADAITTGQLDTLLSGVVTKSIETGNYYNSWIAVFDSATDEFSRTVNAFVPSVPHEMAIAFGGGIAFQIGGIAHVWYAGHVYKITHSLSGSSIGTATPALASEIVYDVETQVALLIGSSTQVAGDFMQGFVSGYANDGWLVITDTRETTHVIRIFKIENSKLVYDSSITRNQLDLDTLDTYEYINVPFKLNVIIDADGSTVAVSGHQFQNETDTDDLLSDAYITGYSNPDLVTVFKKSAAGDWASFGSLTGDMVTEPWSAPMSSFVESLAFHNDGSHSYLVAASGSDITFTENPLYRFFNATSNPLKARPGKLHTFDINAAASPTRIAECNDLRAVSDTNFINSTYANLNFWCAVPMSAHNGTQSMAFSPADSSMYFSTFGEMARMLADGEGAWKLKNISISSRIMSTVSAFNYPFPSSICTDCSTQVNDDVSVLKAPRVVSGLVSGSSLGGKRSLAYRPSTSPSLIGIDSAPTTLSAGVSPSSGLAETVDAYQSTDSATYMHNLNSTPRSVDWDTVDGYKLGFSPSTRTFIKRFELSTSSQFGNGLSLVSGATFSPMYAASFATCPPVWDSAAQLWSWAGIAPVRLSSSHTFDNTSSPVGPLMQMNWSDVFGLSCFSFNTSNIYAFRETKRDNVSFNDDTSDGHKDQLSSFRQKTVEAGGSDVNSRTGQIILVKSPASLSGTISSEIAVNDFFSSGNGPRFVMDGPGSVTVAATNASGGAKDVVRICKSGIPLFARDHAASPVGSVLVLIDDSTDMDTVISSGFSSCMMDYVNIPSTSRQILPFEVSEDEYPLNVLSMHFKSEKKYSVDTISPLYRRSRFMRSMRSVMSMLDPLHGDMSLNDSLLVATSSSLSANSPSTQIFPSPVNGVSFPFRCVCQEDLIQASMRAALWNTKNSTEDIFGKIVQFSSASTFTRGSLFSKVSPESASNKFSHIVIFCGKINMLHALSAEFFADTIYNELTKTGTDGILKADGSLHIIDLNSSDHTDHKKALGAYGTYCAWHGGGM